MRIKSYALGMSLFAALVSTSATRADIQYNEDSISKGQRIYTMNCTTCHGNDGKATVNFVSDATNLTTPEQWRAGNTKQHVFDAIKNGQAVDMPAFEWILDGDEDIWHLVNYVLSLWPEEARQKALSEYQPN